MDPSFKYPADTQFTDEVNKEIKKLLLHLYGNLNAPNAYECYRSLDFLMGRIKPNTIEFNAVKSGICFLIEKNFKIQKDDLIVMCASILILLTKGKEGNDLIGRMGELKRLGANFKEFAKNTCACENCKQNSKETHHTSRPEKNRYAQDLLSISTRTYENSNSITGEKSMYETSSISTSYQEMSRPSTTDTTSVIVPIAAARSTKSKANTFSNQIDINPLQNVGQSEYPIVYADDTSFLDI